MKRRDEVLVGIFTTTAIIIAIIGSLWLVQGALTAGYPLYVRFPWGVGLKQGQPVWLVGVTVGFVNDVDLDPTGSLVVTLSIDKDYKIPKGTTAQVLANGLFGDQAIGLTPSKPNPEAMAAGDTIPVGPSTAGMQSLMNRADTMTAAMNAVISAVKTQMVDSSGLAQLRRSLAATNRFMVQLGRIAETQSKELQQTQAMVRSKLSAIDSLQVDSTVRSFRAAAASADEMVKDLRTTTARLNALLTKVESGDGTLTKLLNDPAMYNDLRQLMAHTDSILLDFKRNPRKYLKFSVF